MEEGLPASLKLSRGYSITIPVNISMLFLYAMLRSGLVGLKPDLQRSVPERLRLSLTSPFPLLTSLSPGG